MSAIPRCCRLRVSNRVVPVAMVIGVLIAGCGGADANLTDQPTDLGSARDLAEAVANQAGCHDVEDFSLTSDDHWDFSCQFAEDIFVIGTANSTRLRDAARPTASAYKVGDYYLVTPSLGRAGMDRLDAFPGELVNATATARAGAASAR